MKLPHLRGQLDSAVRDNEPLLEICQAYAEAIGYRDQLRNMSDAVVLAEYNLLCPELEAEVEELVSRAKSWTSFGKEA